MLGNAIPGYESLETFTPREFLYSLEKQKIKPGGVQLDGTNGIDGGNTGTTYDIRSGWLLGRITSSGKYVPLKRTRVNMTGATATDIVVDNSYPFAAGDVISIGSDTGLTISAVDYTTHTITIASTTVADNEAVVAEDGSQTCRGILWDTQRLRNYLNTAAADKIGTLLTGGVINTAGLLGDWDAVLASGLSNHFLGDFEFWTNGVQVG